MKKAIFIHGLGAGANSRTGKLLKGAMPEYEWAFPEVTHLSAPSLAALREMVQEVKPDFIIGTSLGGFYALCITNEVECPVIVLNSVLDAQSDILRFIGENHYFCKRLDKQKFFTVTAEDCVQFEPKEVVEASIQANFYRLYSFHCLHDELLGYDYHTKYEVLFGTHDFPTDLMGHSVTEEFITTTLKPFINNLIR